MSTAKQIESNRDKTDEERQHQLREDGFCVFPHVLPGDLLARLRETSEALLNKQSAEALAQHQAQGSMLPVTAHPLFAELIALPEALDCLRVLGWDHPSYTDGYIISKPVNSPRLFWHYDWFAWEDPSAYAPEPPQLFLMWYLSDTTPQNGCLRVIPGSHVTQSPARPARRATLP